MIVGKYTNLMLENLPSVNPNRGGFNENFEIA